MHSLLELTFRSQSISLMRSTYTYELYHCIKVGISKLWCFCRSVGNYLTAIMAYIDTLIATWYRYTYILHSPFPPPTSPTLLKCPHKYLQLWLHQCLSTTCYHVEAITTICQNTDLQMFPPTHLPPLLAIMTIYRPQCFHAVMVLYTFV